MRGNGTRRGPCGHGFHWHVAVNYLLGDHASGLNLRGFLAVLEYNKRFGFQRASQPPRKVPGVRRYRGPSCL